MGKPVTFSHSSLKQYELCPRQYHEVKVLKNYPFTDTQATLYGKEFHEAAEFYIKDGTPLPPQFSFAQATLDALKAKPGRKLCEYKMGVRHDLSPCDFMDKDVWCRGIADLLIIDDDNLTARVVDYKGLAIDTELPTPTGWTTMGEVRVGDTLFSESGDVCTVTGKSEIKNIRCFRVTFDDTTQVVCDEEHLWKLADGSVVNVQQMHGKKAHPTGPSPSVIAVAGALALPDIDLGVDPYVFGLWLADGKHTSGEISKPDTFVWEEIVRRGYGVDMNTGGSKSCQTRTAKGLSAQLKRLGVLGNKHIPEQFLRAGYAQRLDLLRGLMDGDGSANPTRRQAVFMNTDRKLSESVAELLSSLGQRPLVSTIMQRGFGLTVTAYPVSFRPVGINPFLLPRKAQRIDPSWGAGKSSMRRVVSVEEIPSVPTQCIAVDSMDHTFLCTRRMVPTHNTGNNKYPDREQLRLMALMVFAHFPHIRRVSGALLFVLKDDIAKASFMVGEAQEYWWDYRQRVARIEQAHETGVWNPKPTPLCGWCVVATCEHNRKRS